MTIASIGDVEWVTVCELDRLSFERGAAVLIDDYPVALFRMRSGEVFGVDHVEPFSGMPVIARGLIGSVGETPTVASPLHKQRFDLRTGVCLDDPDKSLRSWPVRLVGQPADDPVQMIVQVGRAPTCSDR